MKKVPFVSTNDIIVTELFSLAKCDVGMMFVNFRNRIQDITENLSGNYDACIFYQKTEYEKSEYIRLSLGSEFNKGLFKRVNSSQFPGIIDSLSSKICLLTSWATFYYDL